MPEYLAPGVYIEEIQTGPRPIEGVSTSTAGFVGETERGPTRLRLVTSWQDYTRWFGGYVDRPPFNRLNHYLPYAVRGFFDNGGQRLFVARVIGDAAVAATVELPGTPGATTIRANGKGDWGNNILLAVKQTSAAQFAAPNSPVAQWFRIQVLYYKDGVPDPFVDPTDPEKLADPNRKTPDAFEDLDNLSSDPTLSNFATTIINGASQLIEVVQCLGAPNVVAFPDVILQNGTYVVATRDDYLDAATVNPEDRKGLAGLSSIREISLLSIPDEVEINDLAADLQDKCDAMKDRFAILSDQGPNGNVPRYGPCATVRMVRSITRGCALSPLTRQMELNWYRRAVTSQESLHARTSNAVCTRHQPTRSSVASSLATSTADASRSPTR